jgi:hypothetical protein
LTIRLTKQTIRPSGNVLELPDGREASVNKAGQAALARLAPLLRGQRRSPEATILYDVMSDALIWSDESPDFRVLRTINGWQILRFVFRYRTQVILGDPEGINAGAEGCARLILAESRVAWNEARRLFPEWPGFHTGRYSPDLRRVYESLSAESKEKLGEIQSKLDAGSFRT